MPDIGRRLGIEDYGAGAGTTTGAQNSRLTPNAEPSSKKKTWRNAVRSSPLARRARLGQNGRKQRRLISARAFFFSMRGEVVLLCLKRSAASQIETAAA